MNVLLEKDSNIQTDVNPADAWKHRQNEYLYVVVSRKRGTGAKTGYETEIFGMWTLYFMHNSYTSTKNLFEKTKHTVCPI